MLGLWYVAFLDASPISVDVPFCVSCGGKPTDRVSVYAMPFVEAPYCDECAARARTKEWSAALAIMAASFVGPFVLVLLPWGDVDRMAFVAFAVSFFGPLAFVLFTSFRSRIGPAVRAHKLFPSIQIDCARRDVADALVKACGGAVQSHRSLRLTPAIAVVPLAVVSCAFGFGGARYLFVSTLAIDDAATVWVDGRENHVEPGRHAEVSVRVGRRTIAWKRGDQRVEKTVDVDRKHDMLLNPGPTACYRKQVSVVYRSHLSAAESAELASAGLLPLSEFHVLPTVKNWFQPLPDQKNKDSTFESDIDVGVLRDERCSSLLHDGCAPFLECVRAAKDAYQMDACVAQADSSCRRP